MAVTIDIDIRAGKASATIERLRGELATLDDDFDLNLEGDLGDTLDDITDMRRELSKIETSLKNMDGMDDLDFDVNFPDGDGDGMGGPDPDSGRGGGRGPPAADVARRIERRFGLDQGFLDVSEIRNMDIEEVNAEIGEFVDRSGRNPYPNKGLLFANRGSHDLLLDDEGRFFDAPDTGGVAGQMQRGQFSRTQGQLRRAAQVPSADFRKVAGLSPSTRWNRASFFDDFTRNIDTLAERLSFLKFRLKSLKPSMRQWYNLLAAILPILIAFGVQAAGVGAAMLTMAGAGAALIGMGLAGEGETIGEAFENAQSKIRNFGEELFSVLQPTFAQFTPISDRLLDQLPSEFSGNALESLLVYEDDVGRMFSGIIGWFGELAYWAAENRDIISQLSFRFGDILGDNLINLLSWLTTEAFENQEVLIQLGETIKTVGKVIYNFSVVVSTLVAVFEPVLTLLLWISEVLTNRWVIAILSAITMTTLLIKTMSVLGGMFAAVFGKSLLTAYIGFITTYTSGMAGAITATLGLVAAIGLLTAGLSVLAGYTGFKIASDSAIGDVGELPGGGNGTPSIPGAGGGRGGQSVVYNDNRQYQITSEGQMDTDQEQRIRDTIDDVNTEETAMQPPAPGMGYGGN